MKSHILVNVFKEMVETISTELTPALVAYDPMITGVHYQHGHPAEIIETLAQRDKADTFTFKKYPLVALFQDFPYHKGQIGFEGEATFHLIIASGTSNTYKAAERYEKNFIPVLYPIYEELMEEINRSKYFTTASVSQIKHTQIDRLYWGREGLYKNEGNVFNDFIDCIEIRDLKLKVNLKNCY